MCRAAPILIDSNLITIEDTLGATSAEKSKHLLTSSCDASEVTGVSVAPVGRSWRSNCVTRGVIARPHVDFGSRSEIHHCRLIAIKSLLVLIDVAVNANRGPAVTSGGAMLTARS